MSKLKKFLAEAALVAAPFTLMGEKNENYDMDTMPSESITMTINTDQTFNLPGGIVVKESDLKKFQKEDENLQKISMLSKQQDGFDGLSIKLDGKTHYILMNENSFKSTIPVFSFLTSEKGDLSKAHQMSEDDFDDVKIVIKDALVFLGEAGTFDLKAAVAELKNQAAQMGYPRSVLVFAGTEMTLKKGLEATYDNRDPNTPDLSNAKKKQDEETAKKYLYAALSNGGME